MMTRKKTAMFGEEEHSIDEEESPRGILHIESPSKVRTEYRIVTFLFRISVRDRVCQSQLLCVYHAIALLS